MLELWGISLHKALNALTEGVLPKDDLTRALSEECLAANDVKPVEMLFLGPFAVTFEVDRQLSFWREELELQMGGLKLRAIT